MNISNKIKSCVLKIKNVLLDSNLYIFFLITILFYFGFSRLSYTRCTYRMYHYDWKDEFKHYIEIGRCITAFAWALVSLLKLKLSTVYLYSFSLAIFSITFSMYKIYFVVNQMIKNRNMSLIISLLSIINIFLIDYFVYLEKGIMAFSILMAVMAICNLDSYFENKNKKYLFYSAICMLLVNISYQASAGLFIAFALILILNNSKNIKMFLRNNVMVAFIYGIPLIFDFLIIKFTNTSGRNEGYYDIFKSTARILKLLGNIFVNSFNTLPKMFFIIVFFIFFVIFVIAIFDKKCKKNILIEGCKINNNLKIILGFLFVIFGTIFIAVFPQYSYPTGKIWLSTRSIFVIASLFGLIVLFINKYILLNSFLSRCIIVVSIIYLSVEFVYLQYFIQDFYKVNELDKVTAIQVENEIKKYEEKTGIEVKYVTYYKDKNVLDSYPEIISCYEINQKIISRTWRNLSLLGFYTSRNLDLRNSLNKEEYVIYFEGKDWDYFDSDQLIFENDTLHWCLF